MAERDKVQQVKDEKYREIIVKTAQADFNDPNLSETWKDAVLKVSVEELEKMNPKEKTV